MSGPVTLTAREERWPIAGAFVISRGAKTEAQVVVVELMDAQGRLGRGESVPYPRYGETIAGVLAAIESIRPTVEAGAGRADLQAAMPAGAARNAIDCALWDVESKQAGLRAWRLADLSDPRAMVTAYTLSFGPAVGMAAAAAAAAGRPFLKLKIGGPDDLDRVEAVRAAAPAARLIVDANEALGFDDLRRLAPELARLDVRLVEQPLAAGADQELEGFVSPVPLCADESIHTRAELPVCGRRYSAVNIKLDKTGGLTEALALKVEAQARGLRIMAGCMVATSLSMAPALLIAQDAAFVDLDGPLLLARDRAPGLEIRGSTLHPARAELWG